MRHLGAVRRAVIVVNTLAPGAAEARWKKLFQFTLGKQVELTEVRVNHFEGAYAAARGAAAWGADLVIAVGGDGTVNACVNGLDRSETRLAVVPAGTANDLARLVGQSGDPGVDAVGMESWERLDIDAITVNDTRYYSTGGIGWVAEVARTANRWRAGSRARRWLLSHIGSLIYTLACVAVIVFSRRLGGRMRVRYTDAATGRDCELDFDGYGVLAANSRKVGSSFHLAPVSEMDDGVFELIVFEKRGRWRLLQAVIQAQRGRLFELPEVRWIQATSAQLTCEEPAAFFGDGETLATSARFDIGIAPTPVRLMAPVVAEADPIAASQPAAQPIGAL